MISRVPIPLRRLQAIERFARTHALLDDLFVILPWEEALFAPSGPVTYVGHPVRSLD